MKTQIDIRKTCGDYTFRFTNFFDEEAKDFEDCKVKTQSSSEFIVSDEEGHTHQMIWPVLTFWQSHHFNSEFDLPFYVLQMSNTKTKKYYQTVISVEVSKISLFKNGIIRQWTFREDHDSLLDQKIFLEFLINSTYKYTDLMTLRIQPYVPGNEAIKKAVPLVQNFGFKKCTPMSYEKSRFVDLRNDLEETFKLIAPRKRTQLRMKREGKFAIHPIHDKSCIPHLEKALSQSFMRSAGATANFDFATIFSVTDKYPKDVIKMGFTLSDEPDIPKAFAFGLNHKEIFEFSVGGSLSDEALRKYPFNLMLIWELITEAKKEGGHFFDLGGITNGTEEDSLAGISNFKRGFPGFEIPVGHEMMLTLRPVRSKIYSALKTTKERLS